MRIAFISYEYPKETGGGGIGTYLELMSKLLIQHGHSIVVFSGTINKEAFWETNHVFRVPAIDWNEFDSNVADFFLVLHEKKPFDVVECTDYKGCGLTIKKILPAIPIVVRLHTPLYMVDRLLFQPLQLLHKFRFILGAIKRFQYPTLPKPPKKEDYKEEFELIRLAERICSPSYSIFQEMKKLQFQVDNKTDLVPLPFVISNELKNIEARKTIRQDPQIVFIGRLEKRKGVIELAKAIPSVLKQFPNSHFTFVGSASLSPINGVDMIAYLKHKLKNYLHALTFTGKIDKEKVSQYLTLGDIFVFPSHYESFGLACCEAMAAGKAVVGSFNGGMAEIIEQKKSGLLVSPKQSKVLSDEIINLIENDQLRLEIGNNARKRIEMFLNKETIVKDQVDCYKKAISAGLTKCVIA